MKKILFLLVLVFCFTIQISYAGVGLSNTSEIDETTDEEFKMVGLGIKYYSYGLRPYILEVIDNSPADKAGLLPGDLIIEINGEKKIDISCSMMSEYSCVNILKDSKEGDTVDIMILRDGKVNKFNIILSEFSYLPKTSSSPSIINETSTSMLGSSNEEATYSIDNYKEEYEYYALINYGNLIWSDNEFQGTNKFYIFDTNGDLNEDVFVKQITSKEFKININDFFDSPEGKKMTFLMMVAIKIDDKFYYAQDAIGLSLSLPEISEPEYPFTDEELKKLKIIAAKIEKKAEGKGITKEELTIIINNKRDTLDEGSKLYAYLNKILEFILESEVNALLDEFIDNIDTFNDDDS